MTYLRLCPKCGGKAELFANRALSTWGYYVGCLDCFRKTALCDTPEEAIASWNEGATPLTDGSGDQELNTPMALCCKGMLGLIMNTRLSVDISKNGKVDLYIRGVDTWVTPLRYCPACGRDVHLTFLADRREKE